ncbi:DUF3667 domain-containing protein [Confluentibacter sediminis]|uniref:DUF3667 domain-containing protein n=1 Tax=Confluentibacter sediminis TaxID=2219045 RepID=UPI000DAD7FEC|nr:DUF3667 domain-containing protein [Confluentibacter sediminis]
MSIKHVACKNCERTFKDDYNFCPYCGQNDKEELTLGVLFSNTISNYFSVDARFFKSFWPLMAKPGYLASKFVEGKRLRYLHPAQMYLFVSVVFFFFFSFIEREQVESLDRTFSESFKKERELNNDIGENTKDSLLLDKKNKKHIADSIAKVEITKALAGTEKYTHFSNLAIDSLNRKVDNRENGDFDFKKAEVDSLIDAGASNDIIYKAMGLKEGDGYFKQRLYTQGLKIYKTRQGGGILKTFYDAVPIAMFFLLPIFALILKLLYRKRGSYSYHLVFSFYYFAFLFTVFTIIIIVNFIVDIPDGIDWLIALSTFIYLCLALSKFYQQGKFKSFIKGSMASFLFLSFVAPTTVLILAMFAFLFY